MPTDHSCGGSRGLEELAVKVPLLLLADAPRMNPMAAPLIRSFGKGDCASRALARLVDRSLRADSASQAGQQVLLDLIARIVGGCPVDYNAVHLVSAKTYVEDHLTDPALGVPQIATAVNLSERQLSRVFATTGESVPQYVMARRLDRAHALLVAPGSPSVSEVAAMTGFASETYFSGAFKKRFGARAVDVLRMSRRS